jgi:hypothetical protein
VECRPDVPAFCVWERGSTLAAERLPSPNRLIEMKNDRTIMPERERPPIKQNT